MTQAKNCMISRENSLTGLFSPVYARKMTTAIVFEHSGRKKQERRRFNNDTAPVCLFSFIQWPIIRDPMQIILYMAVQDQISIGDGIVVDQIVKL